MTAPILVAMEDLGISWGNSFFISDCFVLNQQSKTGIHKSSKHDITGTENK